MPEIESPVSNHVSVTRLIDAPRALVYEAWTTPRHAIQWLRPKGFSTIHCECMDVRPGGSFRLRMPYFDGTEYIAYGTYREVVPGERLVYDDYCDALGARFHAALVTIDFVSRGQQTEVTVSAQLEILEGRDPQWTPERMREGWKNGWCDNLDQLAPFVRAKLASDELDFVITRDFDAPCASVYACWTEADRLAQWWGPRSLVETQCELDVRVGAAYRIVMRSPDGVEYPITGLYKAVVPQQRLVMTMDCTEHPAAWHDMVKPDREPGDSNPVGEMLTTVQFDDLDGRTRLTVRSRFRAKAILEAMLGMGMTEGWSESLDRLTELLSKP